jgi:hypothetical protein
MTEIRPVDFGPATADDLRLDREADAVLEESLKTTRAAAADWAKALAALTGLLGIVALVKGREDVTQLVLAARVLVGLFLLAGLIFAIRAIMFAALAAEGTPTVWWVIGNQLKERYRDERRLAAQQLLRSRTDAVAGIACLIVAVGIAWYGPAITPQPKSPKVLITFTDRGPLCGELTNTDHGLAASDNGHDVSVRGGNVKTMSVVSACPK